MMRRSTPLAAAVAAVCLALGPAGLALPTVHASVGGSHAGACSAPVKPNGGQMPNDLTISPHSGTARQVIHLHLSAALLASRQWSGFYILWDGTQPLEDGGGAPPQDITFTPPDYDTTWTTTFQAQGYHTVGVYDTYNNVGTIEPQDDVASASFYITGGPSVCTTPTINQLQVPRSVHGGHTLHLALTTDPHARVHIAIHVPATAGSSAYTADIETPADSTSGNYDLDMLIPVKPTHAVQAAITITVHIGSNSVQQNVTMTITP